jgi:heterodisulfide reductase subunit A-like polyferredoxin
MPARSARVNFSRCDPENCKYGICGAAVVCRYNLLRQDNPNEIPVPDIAICGGCSDCVRACPNRAIEIV